MPTAVQGLSAMLRNLRATVPALTVWSRAAQMKEFASALTLIPAFACALAMKAEIVVRVMPASKILGFTPFAPSLPKFARQPLPSKVDVGAIKATIES